MERDRRQDRKETEDTHHIRKCACHLKPERREGLNPSHKLFRKARLRKRKADIEIKEEKTAYTI